MTELSALHPLATNEVLVAQLFDCRPGACCSGAAISRSIRPIGARSRFFCGLGVPFSILDGCCDGFVCKACPLRVNIYRRLGERERGKRVAEGGVGMEREELAVRQPRAVSA